MAKIRFLSTTVLVDAVLYSTNRSMKQTSLTVVGVAKKIVLIWIFFFGKDADTGRHIDRVVKRSSPILWNFLFRFPIGSCPPLSDAQYHRMEQLVQIHLPVEYALIKIILVVEYCRSVDSCDP